MIKHGAPGGSRSPSSSATARSTSASQTTARASNPQAVEAGFGLIGMRERVALVGGTLDVKSQPGAGATVHAVIPVVRRPHQVSEAATA